MPEVMSVAQLARSLDPGLVLDDRGRARPAVVYVDLAEQATPTEVDSAIAAVGASGRIAVGVAGDRVDESCEPLAGALDLSIVSGPMPPRWAVSVDAVDRAVAELDADIGRNPQAAAALASLLRQTAELPVRSGLAAESATYSMLLAGREFQDWLGEHPPRPPAPANPTPAVRVNRVHDNLSVVIDRPARRNAFNREVRDGLIDALDLALADDTIRAVRIAGAGPAFCSGGDLDEFGQTLDVSTAHLIRLDRSVAGRIHRARDRIRVDLHGACIGAGIEFSSFAGSVTARPDTVIRLPEVGMGLVPGAGGTVGISRRIGRWRTAWLGLTGAPLAAESALAWGLVDEIVHR